MKESVKHRIEKLADEYGVFRATQCKDNWDESELSEAIQDATMASALVFIGLAICETNELLQKMIKKTEAQK